jgi:hypothetical protein
VASVLTTWSITERIGVYARVDVTIPSTRRTINAIVQLDNNPNNTVLNEIYVVPGHATRGALGIEVLFP